MHPLFLTVEDIVEIHTDQIGRYGGMLGIPEPYLLQSAVAQPCATFENNYLHQNLFEMAAAYLFHIVMNHPFLDGNKRTGAAAALVFLFLNGIEVIIEEDAYADIVLAVAQGRMKKGEIAMFLKAASENAL